MTVERPHRYYRRVRVARRFRKSPRTAQWGSSRNDLQILTRPHRKIFPTMNEKLQRCAVKQRQPCAVNTTHSVRRANRR